ncbi:MAG: metal ABC transporter permease [Planctomycetes bacterium]|nr:metal ABC transporter permease [Planctomycetota bacterium]
MFENIDISLIKLPFLVCMLIGLMLGYMGTHVLRREVIFIDIALAQFAAVGATLAHFVFEGEHTHGPSEPATLEYICSFGGVLVAAFFYAFVRKQITQISLEAVIGVSYAIVFALALFIPGVVGGGHTHMSEMLAGQLIWVKFVQIKTCLAAFAAVVFCCWLFRKPLNELSDNYQQADHKGIKCFFCDVLFYTMMGVVIALSVKIVGVVMVFAFLIIPVTIAALFSGKLQVQIPIIGLVVMIASVAGLGFSTFERFEDFSMGPPIGLVLGIILVICAGIKTIFRSQESRVESREARG